MSRVTNSDRTGAIPNIALPEPPLLRWVVPRVRKSDFLMRVMKSRVVYGPVTAAYGLIHVWSHNRLRMAEVRRRGTRVDIAIPISGGHTIELRLDLTTLSDFLMFRTIASGMLYEPEVTNYLQRNLALGNTFVDVGANSGYYTVLASRLVGSSGRVLAFEPNPFVLPRLRANIAQNRLSNVSVFEVALGDARRECTLDPRPGQDGEASVVNSRRRVDVRRPSNRRVAVQMRTLDDCADGAPVDIIKIDAEGAEPLILAGMKDVIRANSHRGLRIVMEWAGRFHNRDLSAFIFRSFYAMKLASDGTEQPIQGDLSDVRSGQTVNLLLSPRDSSH